MTEDGCLTGHVDVAFGRSAAELRSDLTLTTQICGGESATPRRKAESLLKVLRAERAGE